MWSYDPALPTEKDRIRFLVGDTDESSHLMEDEAIAVLFGQAGDDAYLAAAGIADILANRFSQRNSVWVDSVRIDYANKATGYRDLAQRLRAMSGSARVGRAVVEGVSVGDMNNVSSDTDRIPSSVTIGMHDEPGA